MPVGQSKILRDSELAKRRPDRTNEFFLRPSATQKKSEPDQAEAAQPKSSASFLEQSNGVSNGVSNGATVKSSTTRYQPPRRVAESLPEKPPAPAVEKKSFVPEFLKVRA